MVLACVLVLLACAGAVAASSTGARIPAAFALQNVNYYPYPTNPSQAFTPVSVQAGDIDGDGDEDFVAAGSDGLVVWFENDGTGGFTGAEPLYSCTHSLLTQRMPCPLRGAALSLLHTATHSFLAFHSLGARFSGCDAAPFRAPPRLPCARGSPLTCSIALHGQATSWVRPAARRCSCCH